jgi:IS5 family transposase
MSLPAFSTQSELFSTAALSARLFPEDDRYKLFAKLVYPRLVRARAILEKCYCLENGRIALEPVLMLGVTILQDLDGVPDRKATEMVRYHAGWTLALNRQLGDPVFHPTSLVNFRHRLEEHQQSALAFTAILDALQEAGLVSRQSRQRLDSTQMFGRVARMSRLDCVRESLRLALQELESAVPPEGRPLFWIGLWERDVETQVDYRAGNETLARKLVEAGTDTHQFLGWLQKQAQPEWSQGPQVQLLARVFGEQFEIGIGAAAPLPRQKELVAPGSTPEVNEAVVQPVVEPEVLQPSQPTPAGIESADVLPHCQPDEPALPLETIQPKDKKAMNSDRVRNPHDPEATYATKGQGQQRKEHVGYKVQVAESVSEATLAPGEPTRNFIVGIVTHPAHESDEAGALKMAAEQAAMGLEKPPVQYVDAAYVSAQQLAMAAAEGRELIGPAPKAADNNDGRFTTEQFQVRVEERQAVCPAGKENTQCSRLVEKETGQVSFRFEWSSHCAECLLRGQCVAPKQKHRSIVVGEHHSALQARRQEQKTDAFKERMKHRNGIEGTQSELVRGHGLRRARYRGLAKSKLQNYFVGAACNVKRWLRREAWKIQQAVAATAAQGTAAALS